jgi:hypothetical protein
MTYYCGDKLKGVGVGDTFCTNKGYDKRIKIVYRGSLMFANGVDLLLTWRMQSIDFYIGWRLDTLLEHL